MHAIEITPTNNKKGGSFIIYLVKKFSTELIPYYFADRSPGVLILGIIGL